MMTNSQYGTQDVDFFIGHTASVRILLTDCKGNVTNCQRQATHCSSICAREARNLLLYA